MIISLNFMIAYFIGGLTLFPITILLLFIVYFIFNQVILPILNYYYYNTNQDNFYNEGPLDSALQKGDISNDEATTTVTGTNHLYKVGWLKVSKDDGETEQSSIGDMVVSYISGKSSKREKCNIYFAVLKYNTLYLYDSEKQLDSKGVIILNNNFTVTTHPPGLQDFELFSKPHLIKLKSIKDSTVYYINCNKCIDKEDWFFAFIRASKLQQSTTTRQSQAQEYDKTHFDQSAMNHLITILHSDEHHFQTQWLNAILGRIFFGVYKTNDIKEALYKKVMSKLDKINSKRPIFLGEINVRSVDPGHSLPQFTQPKLLGLSPTGELSAEAYMQYDGGFRIEITTSLNWKYSDRLRPLTLDLVLGITLEKIQGKILIKIKEPPTNRFWYAFYECPKMEWKVEPVVWEKRVGYSVVVKAIETKIQEFIMETMVLPNFDDIIFFPTNGVGGIFEVSPDVEAAVEEEEEEEEVDTTNTTNTKEELTTTTTAIKKSKENTHQERHRDDEALLTTAKSLPELFSAVPDRLQQQSKLRMQQDDIMSTSLFANSAPILDPSTTTMITKNNNISCSPRLIATPDDMPAVTGQIAISNPNNNHDNSESSFLSTSPDSLCSSPSSSTIEDSLRTLTHVLTDDTNMIISPPSNYSPSLVACDTNISQHQQIQITYSRDYTTSSTTCLDPVMNNQQHMRLRKSSSLALLRPKTGASTAVNVSPAMAHKKVVIQQDKKDIDSISAVVSL